MIHVYIITFFFTPRDEYDFLPVPEPKHNRSPLVLQEHKLGIESWSVKILFQYAYNQLIAWRNNSPPTKFLGIISFQLKVVSVNVVKLMSFIEDAAEWCTHIRTIWFSRYTSNSYKMPLFMKLCQCNYLRIISFWYENYMLQISLYSLAVHAIYRKKNVLGII